MVKQARLFFLCFFQFFVRWTFRGHLPRFQLRNITFIYEDNWKDVYTLVNVLRKNQLFRFLFEVSLVIRKEKRKKKLARSLLRLFNQPPIGCESKDIIIIIIIIRGKASDVEKKKFPLRNPSSGSGFGLGLKMKAQV